LSNPCGTPKIQDLHRGVDKAAVKIGLNAFIDECSGGQPRPPFRVVPMVVSDDCSAFPSVVDVRKNVSA